MPLTKQQVNAIKVHNRKVAKAEKMERDAMDKVLALVSPYNTSLTKAELEEALELCAHQQSTFRFALRYKLGQLE